MLHWLRIVAFLVTGAIFGPLLWALAVAAVAPHENSPETVTFLLEEFGHREPSGGFLNARELFFDGRECGYDPEALFARDDPDSFRRVNWEWTPRRGYGAVASLYRWSREVGADYARVQQLEAATSPFGARFLLECMRRTVFAPVCEEATGTLLGTWKTREAAAARKAGQLNEAGIKATACTYLDGVAARRGLPLAKR